jgi:hypothetical protein
VVEGRETCAFWSDCLKGRGHLEDLSVDKIMITNRPYTRWEGVEWINVVEDSDLNTIICALLVVFLINCTVSSGFIKCREFVHFIFSRIQISCIL